MPSNSLRPSKVGSLVLQLRRWPGLVARWGQYHGVWGPGVRALRNQSLRSKTAIVGGLCLLLGLSLFVEVAQLRWEQWRGIGAALQDMRQLRALTQWHAAVLDLQSAAARAEHAPADAASAAASAAASGSANVAAGGAALARAFAAEATAMQAAEALQAPVGSSGHGHNADGSRSVSP